MFDIGWPEMAVIMLVAIIVIGPKDLPRLARTIGQWTGKARAMARDFQRSLDDMAREAELDEIKKGIETAGSPTKLRSTMERSIKKAVDADGALAEDLKIDDKPKAKPSAATASAADAKAEPGANTVPGLASSKPSEPAAAGAKSDG